MTDHQIMPFQCETHQLSAITDDNGGLWWIASDVCEVLEIKNVSDAVARLDADEKSDIVVTDVAGQTEQITVSDA